MAARPQQERRRRDRSRDRLRYERVVLLALGVAGLGGAAFGAWWLWSLSSVGVVIRDGSPNWSPFGRVIFSSEQGGKADLYEADRTGANQAQITNTPGAEGGPAYSPDGRTVAFHYDGDGNLEIYALQAGTDIIRRLTDNPASDQAPAWSRDGKQIVFMSDRDNATFDVYRMNADGTNVERLTNAGSSRFPQYSPDGSQLVLDIERDVHIMSLATRGLRRLTREPDNGMYPAWAPDGLHLAFMSWRNGRSQIFTARPDGSEPQAVVTRADGDAVDPRWSPDGKYIAFVHIPDASRTHAPDPTQQRIVFVLELESGRLSRISR